MIYIDKSSLSSKITKYVIDNFDHTIVENNTIVYDDKRNILLRSRSDEFVHLCPGTKIYRCCSYHNLDVMQGCPFDCSYCILQAYLPHKIIKVSTDIEMIETQLITASASSNIKLRIGSGELADSLAVDHIIPLSKFLIPIANRLDNIQFEFKTKSANIKNLLALDPKNILLSWSLNPQDIIDLEEHNTASLTRRLEAVKIASEYGYKVAFHFDPLIMHEKFDELYLKLLGDLFEAVDEKSVEFISISTFRAPNELIDAMMMRNDLPKLLHADFVRSLDGKTRYFKTIRKQMIKTVYETIKKRWGSVFIYFCMEHSSLWNEIAGFDPGEREEFEQLFCQK